MFESLLNAFLISFREGIEAVLVVMTILVVLRKRGEEKMRKVTIAAVITAIVACSATAYALGSIALVNNPELEVALYGMAALAVFTMVIWMMRTGKYLKKEIETKVASYSGNTSLWAAIGLFSFVFFMVAREGFELSLFLLAFGSGIGGWYYVLAMIAGLAGSIGIGYLLSKGVLKVNVGKFLQATAFILLILVIQLLFDFMHEGMEAGIVPEPSNQGIVNMIDYLSHDLPIFSYIAMLGFLVVIGYYAVRSFGTKQPIPVAVKSN
ncbi:MAG TPA: FTR1 family protein [Candidatus Kapabacteria bacterium]